MAFSLLLLAFSNDNNNFAVEFRVLCLCVCVVYGAVWCMCSLTIISKNFSLFPSLISLFLISPSVSLPPYIVLTTSIKTNAKWYAMVHRLYFFTTFQRHVWYFMKAFLRHKDGIWIPNENINRLEVLQCNAMTMKHSLIWRNMQGIEINGKEGETGWRKKATTLEEHCTRFTDYNIIKTIEILQKRIFRRIWLAWNYINRKTVTICRLDLNDFLRNKRKDERKYGNANAIS